MTGRCTQSDARCRCTRAAVLFEVVVSLVIFATTAGLTLSAASNVLDTLDRHRLRMQAADIASSLMNELDAGLISIEDLRGDPIAAVGTFREQARSGFDQQAQMAGPQWTIDVTTERTEFDGLTLVTITVEQAEQTTGAGATPSSSTQNEVTRSTARFTLRQMMRLRDQQSEQYEEDEILEDLPAPSSQPPQPNAPGSAGGSP